MQFVALKYEIEQMRLHPSIVGYVITEFTDVHWECNGLLDMCRNPKIFHDQIGNLNADDVIVPEIERAALWEGERCAVQLSLSHFSHHDLAGARLAWRIDRWPEIGGVFEQIACAQGQVDSIGTVEFDAPAVQAGHARADRAAADRCAGRDAGRQLPGCVCAAAQRGCHGGRGQRRATGVCARAGGGAARAGLPTTDALDQADVALATTMTDALREYVQQGGRVLWLAEQADLQQAYLKDMGIAPRAGHGWEGDWASNFNWIRQDRMFQHIPTGGTVDFAFADLIPDTVITRISPGRVRGRCPRRAVRGLAAPHCRAGGRTTDRRRPAAGFDLPAQPAPARSPGGRGDAARHAGVCDARGGGGRDHCRRERSLLQTTSFSPTARFCSVMLSSVVKTRLHAYCLTRRSFPVLFLQQ